MSSLCSVLNGSGPPGLEVPNTGAIKPAYKTMYVEHGFGGEVTTSGTRDRSANNDNNNNNNNNNNGLIDDLREKFRRETVANDRAGTTVFMN